MTGAFVTVTVDDAGVRERLARAARATSNLLPLMEEISGSLETSTRHHFEVGIGPDGQPWKRSQRAIEHGGQTLVDKGLLLASVTHHATRDMAEVSESRIYAAIQQFGGRAGRNRAVELPARPSLGLGADDEREIGAIIDDYLRRAIA